MNKITIAVADAIAQRFGVPSQREVSANLSDAESGVAFMISQVSYLEQEMYAAKYFDIVFDKLVPIDTSIPEGASSVTYRSYDGATVGKFLGARADDIPLVSAEAQLHTVPLGYAGVGTKYSLDELRTPAMAGMPIDATQAEIAFRGARQHQQKTVFFGYKSRNMFGLLNHPNVTKTNSTVNWSTATPDQIIEDVNKAISTVWVNSNQVFLPNTLLIDTERYTALVNKKSSDIAFKSVIDYIETNNLYTKRTGQKLTIEPLPHLSAEVLKANGVSNSNKARMVAYVKDKKCVKAYMPIPPRFVAPQLKNLDVITPMEYKISGTEYIYPTSAIYVDAM